MKRPDLGAGAVIFFAMSLLLLPLRWIVAWSIAAVVHEVCHYLAVRVCGGAVSGIRVGATGARMDVGGLGHWQEVFCALAGPAGGIMLLSVARWFPRVAICALAQSLFNLLPVYPLDGGRAMRCAIRAVLPEGVAFRVCDIMQRGALLGLVIIGLYSSVSLHGGIVPGLGALLLAIRWFPVKRPCISEVFSVQ